ncbi:MAG: glycosyltransferase family 4 protein [Thermomicrobiales bacterium]
MAPLRVLILTRYGPLAASARLRFHQYLPFLERQGFSLTVDSLLGDDYVRRLYAHQAQDRRRIIAAYGHRVSTLLRAQQFDLIWLQYDLFPWAPGWWDDLLLPARVPYVLDLDDAMYHRYDLHASPFVRRVLGRKYDQLMARSALVVAGNAAIAERASTAGAPRVEIVPTVVDLDRYPLAAPSSGDSGNFVVGWIGSPATSSNLHLLRPALEALSEIHPTTLRCVGAGKVDLGPGITVDARPWSESSEASDIGSFDVGCMPLVDSPFERGKSGFKLIQCMACGLPVVASPVGVNAEIVTPGANGFLASSPEAWFEALLALANDPGLRCEMGANGRRKVETSYSLQMAAPILAEALRRAAA